MNVIVILVSQDMILVEYAHFHALLWTTFPCQISLNSLTIQHSFVQTGHRSEVLTALPLKKNLVHSECTEHSHRHLEVNSVRLNSPGFLLLVFPLNG